MNGPADALVGSTLAGRYRLDGLIGQGGMGAVYRAQDTRLERPVALKLLLPEERSSAGSTQRRLRFLREARLSARIRHPNVVRVLGFGVMERDPAARDPRRGAVALAMASALLQVGEVEETLRELDEGGHVEAIAETLFGVYAIVELGLHLSRRLPPEDPRTRSTLLRALHHAEKIEAREQVARIRGALRAMPTIDGANGFIDLIDETNTKEAP